MNPIHSDLQSVLDAVEILSPVSYRIRGELREVAGGPAPVAPVTADVLGGGTAAGERPSGPPPLLLPLEAELYGSFYTRQPPGYVTTGDALLQRDFMSALSAANNGQGTWEVGWKVERFESDGRVVVSKDGITFWAPPTAVRTRVGGPTVGSYCRVWVAKEIRHLMPGFYFAIGDGNAAESHDDDKPLVRLYWHLTAEAAPRYIAAVTQALNTLRVPFRTKVLSDPRAYFRADAGVLYLGRRHFARVAPAVRAVHRALAGGLRLDTPLFVKTLRPGLGLAEDPSNGMSFGQHRCKLLAGALWRSFQRREADRAEKYRTAAAVFREANLDPTHPYLEPGSADDYFLARHPSRGRGRSAGRARTRSKRDRRKR